jgi:hypothetical protein
MIERLIYIALAQGIEDAQAKPRIIEEYFRKVKRIEDQSELDSILELFANNPPRIIHQYPREQDTETVPLWAITLQNENESMNFLGDEGDIIGELPADEIQEGVPGGWLDPDDPEAGADELAAIYTKRYQILTYSKHPDVTIAYYQLCRLFMTRARNFLKCEAELMRLNFSGGDIFPDPRYIPAHLFARQMTIEVEMVERMAGAMPARAFTVKGLHFPTEENVKTVDARVTVTEPGQEDD